MKLSKRILALSLFAALGGPALASERMPGGFFPLDETAFAASGNSAAHRVAPGVYEVVDKGRRVSVAYGIDGLRYRVSQLESMLSGQTAKQGAARRGAELLLETFRSRLVAAESNRAKGYSDLHNNGCAHDGYVYAESTAEPGFNWAFAEAAASFDGFGPAPEGNFYVETEVMQQGYWYGPSCTWATTAHSQAVVTSVFGASTGDYTTVSSDGYSSGGGCADVVAIASFLHEGQYCASVSSGM